LRIRARRIALAALVACCAIARAEPACAYFERIVLSARSASLGGAFVAVADDPSAVADNAAGLTGIQSLSFLSTYDRPYGVEGINEGYLAAAVPLSGLSAGVSWFHRGVQGALSEDLLTLAIARDLKRTSEDASLSVGLTADLAHVSTQAEGSSSQMEFTCGASVLLRPFAFIGLGYSIRNIIEPSFDLIDGGGATGLNRGQAFGLSYYWQQRLLATVESRQDAEGDWKARGGLEVRIQNRVFLRGGLEQSHVTTGAGIAAGGFTADIGMTSNDDLGATYLFTLRYARPVVSPY
jgi:hypothetical protein